MRRFGGFHLWIIVFVGIVALTDSCARPHSKTSRTTPVPGSLPSARATVPAPAPTPVRTAEIRGVWVSDTPRLDWDSATANLQRAGFNTIYCNFATGGAAFYPNSKQLPAAKATGQDPIANGVALAHRRGLAVHAKQIVMFMFKATPEFQKQLVQTDRVMRGPDARPVLQAGYAWLCPSREENRALAVSVLGEMLGRYNVDGLQFDYIRFSEQPCCYCANCRREFERSIGVHFRHWPGDVMDGGYIERFNQWRQQLITDWVRDLTGFARKVRPGLTLSAAVFSDLERAREEKGQDWKLWLERGYLDYVCTMTYTPDLQDFETRVRKQQVWAPRRDQIVVGIGSWKFDRLSSLSSQIGLTRRLGTPGFVLFSYDDSAARNFLPDLTVATSSAAAARF